MLQNQIPYCNRNQSKKYILISVHSICANCACGKSDKYLLKFLKEKCHTRNFFFPLSLCSAKAPAFGVQSTVERVGKVFRNSSMVKCKLVPENINVNQLSP